MSGSCFRHASAQDASGLIQDMALAKIEAQHSIPSMQASGAKTMSPHSKSWHCTRAATLRRYRRPVNSEPPDASQGPSTITVGDTPLVLGGPPTAGRMRFRGAGRSDASCDSGVVRGRRRRVQAAAGRAVLRGALVDGGTRVAAWRRFDRGIRFPYRAGPLPLPEANEALGRPLVDSWCRQCYNAAHAERIGASSRVNRKRRAGAGLASSS